MNSKNYLFIIFIIFLLLNIAVVSANDMNCTDLKTSDFENNSQDDNISVTVNKTTPSISIKQNNIYTGHDIEITFLDSNNTPIFNQSLITKINNQKNSFLTDEDGNVKLKANFPAKSYILDVCFKGDENYNPLNKSFNVKILKLNSKIVPVNSTVIRGNYIYTYLKDADNNPIKGVKINYVVNGKKFEKSTNSNGKSCLKMNLEGADYSVKISFSGNSYCNSISKTIKFRVVDISSIVIGNTRVLTNGFLRIYLKSPSYKLISKKSIKISIDGKTISKKTNTEGIVIFKPKLNKGFHHILVSFEGNSHLLKSNSSKKIKCIKGNPKNPFKSKIPLKNGVPDVDFMTGSFVMADNDMTYTLLKNQYKDVIKRDSYCLFLKNKLSKYTVFKTKSQPKLNHIIVREKWNVIERAINTKVVKKNKPGYWPSQITVNLKGKSYTYSEVRDIQNTGYSCGPTSCSMCSQVLRNYVNEMQFIKQAGTSSSYGSSTKGLKKALEKNHFKCTYYYKSSFDKALKQLKKGGCALVFHTWGHFVSILDISKDGKKVLVGNPSGDYNHGSHKIPTKWLTVKYMKKRFNNYDTSGLIVKLKYSLSKNTKTKTNNFYTSMGKNWNRQNTNERIPNIGL